MSSCVIRRRNTGAPAFCSRRCGPDGLRSGNGMISVTADFLGHRGRGMNRWQFPSSSSSAQPTCVRLAPRLRNVQDQRWTARRGHEELARGQARAARRRARQARCSVAGSAIPSREPPAAEPAGFRGYGENLTGVASCPMNPRLPGPANEDKGGGSGRRRKKGLFSRIVKPKGSAKGRRKRKGKGKGKGNS